MPRTPSRLELQLNEAEIVPSSPSVAVPVKVTIFPEVDDEPLAGAVIVTIGAVFEKPPSGDTFGEGTPWTCQLPAKSMRSMEEPEGASPTSGTLATPVSSMRPLVFEPP